MEIAAYRKDVLQISQEEFAKRLGLKSKSRVCEIERANRCPPKIALEIERMSGGLIGADDICPAVAMIRG